MDYQSICALRLPVCAVMFQKSMEFSVVTSETGPGQSNLRTLFLMSSAKKPYILISRSVIHHNSFVSFDVVFCAF